MSFTVPACTKELYEVTLQTNVKRSSIEYSKTPSNQNTALELHSRATPSAEAHHRVNGPDTRKNSGGRIKKEGVPVRQSGGGGQISSTTLYSLCGQYK